MAQAAAGAKPEKRAVASNRRATGLREIMWFLITGGPAGLLPDLQIYDEFYKRALKSLLKR
ncbi:hypothetical protein [Phaeobacter gallaeciensis]|uniref:hypothetical protein n=1 Tax=Phaeobacter gallaeciensis TaxID=60890 RepID=UPI003A8C769E